MIIRRKVFSRLMDENNDEKLFCVNETELCYEEREFSEEENDEDEDKVYLEDVNSHRGLGRSAILGGYGGAVGGYAGKKYAEKLDREGKSDREIMRESTKRARRVGAGIAGVGGLAVGLGSKMGAKAVPLAVANAAVGGVAAHLGAKKNAKTRMEKRAKVERDKKKKENN